MENRQILKIAAAYTGVVLIWSTTPLAIKWSGEDVGFLFGITARMSIGAILALLLTLVRFGFPPLHSRACAVYAAAGVSIYGAMMAVYWGAQYIPSGLISVVFGLAPILTAVFAQWLLQEPAFTPWKIFGALLGLTGLLGIFYDQISFGHFAALGIIAVLLSVTLHSISSVWVKKLDARLPALTVTAGGLVFALPLFLLSYVLFEGEWPAQLPLRPILSIVYLGIMGSVVGFVSYYYLLSNLRASSVALITLITPVMALLLGNLLNHEVLTSTIVLGTILIVAGLLLHQWGERLSKRVWLKR